MLLCAERDRRYAERADRMESDFRDYVEKTRRELLMALQAHDRLVAETDRRTTLQFLEGEKQCLAAAASQSALLAQALASAEKAVNVRADAHQREFHEHLNQNRHETDLAFTASEKAIS